MSNYFSKKFVVGFPRAANNVYGATYFKIVIFNSLCTVYFMYAVAVATLSSHAVLFHIAACMHEISTS